MARSLDREKYGTATLYVTASDQARPNRADHALIQIEILDVNDNKPTFTRSFYQVSVYANTPKNAYLLRVEAYDLDAGENGLVRYSFGEEQSMVVLDEETGVIRLGKNLCFDCKISNVPQL